MGTGTDFLGLEVLVDDGSNDTTIGGLTRTAYTPNLSSTVTAAASSTLTLAQIDTLYSNVKSGSVEPTAYYTTEAVGNFYRQLLTPQERIQKTSADMKGGMSGGTGFTSLTHMGKPIIEDEKCTSGILYLLNEDFMDFHALPMEMTEAIPFKNEIEGNDYSSVKGLGFSWSGWIKPTNAAALVAHIYLGGQLVQRNPKRSGKLTNVTAV